MQIVKVSLVGLEEILKAGSCSGCGACAVAEPDVVSMEKKPNGIILPTRIRENIDRNPARVCPFSSDLTLNRRELGSQKTGSSGSSEDLIGSYVFLGAGRILGDEIWKSSSGGLTTWLLCQLLENGAVDGIIHLGDSSTTSSVFEYKVSRTTSEVLQNRGSKYYASSFKDALETIRSDTKKYAFIGVPCFINAIDLLRADSDLWGEKIVFTIGLVCGHLKSEIFTEALSWQLGVAPSDIQTVNFRIKDPLAKSSDYLFGSQSKSSGRWASRKVNTLTSSNWGQNAFSLQACSSCTDLFGYTSDVTFGDAWLNRYESESRGTNIVVIRNPAIAKLFEIGSQSNQIFLEELESTQILESQQGGIRHRVEGYLIRRNKQFRSLSPQSDFHTQFPSPSLRRRILVAYRAYISKVTSRQTHLNDKAEFTRWIRGYRRLAITYGVIDIVARFSWKKAIQKIRHHRGMN